MQVNRKDLITALELCEPALSPTSRAAELTHFWFSDKRISAYNGHLTIAATIDLDLHGGIPGTMLSWLKKTGSDSVTLTQIGSTLSVTAGKSRASFAMLDAKRQFTPPSLEQNERMPISAEMVQALSRVIISHDNKSNVAAKMGVFMIPGTNFPEEELELYATDDTTISAELVPLPDIWPIDFDIVVSIPFIKQLFKHMPMGGTLYISTNTISFAGRNFVVTGNLIQCKMPDFRVILDTFNINTVPIPDGFAEALDRVGLIDGPVHIAISNDTLYLTVSDKKNCIEEEFPLAVSGHPSIMEVFDAKLLKRALAGRTHMNLVANGMRLVGPPGFVHLIGAVIE